MSAPKLIEPSTKYFLFNTLEQCHQTRVELYSTIWNVSIVVVFVLITGIVLYLCFKRKRTPDENQQRLIKEQSYILDKIRSFKELDSYRTEHNSISKLPISSRDTVIPPR
jgi:hypothetical protein